METLADSSKFPKEWLFKYRWAKGKKDAEMKLADGTKFVYLTVGGRTSAVVPSVQKKTGPVAKDVDENGEESQTKKGGKKRKATLKDDYEAEEEEVAESKPASKKGRAKKTPAKEEQASDEKPVNGTAHEHAEDAEHEETKTASKKQKSDPKTKTNGNAAKSPGTKKTKSAVKQEESAGRRRSGRVSDKEVSYAED